MALVLFYANLPNVFILKCLVMLLNKYPLSLGIYGNIWKHRDNALWENNSKFHGSCIYEKSSFLVLCKPELHASYALQQPYSYFTIVLSLNHHISQILPKRKSNFHLHLFFLTGHENAESAISPSSKWLFKTCSAAALLLKKIQNHWCDVT